MSLDLPHSVELLGGINFDVPVIANQTWTNHTRLLSTEPVSAVLAIAAANVVADPGDPQSYNRYSYVRNGPLNRVDATGHVDCGLLGDGSDSAGCLDPRPTIPMGPMVTFDPSDAWVNSEKGTISSAALRTGKALSQTINSLHPTWSVTSQEAFKMALGN